jgi:hypothetical protein
MKRSDQFSVKLTPSERSRVRELAKEAGLSEPDWFRSLLTHKKNLKPRSSSSDRKYKDISGFDAHMLWHKRVDTGEFHIYSEGSVYLYIKSGSSVRLRPMRAVPQELGMYFSGTFDRKADYDRGLALAEVWDKVAAVRDLGTMPHRQRLWVAQSLPDGLEKTLERIDRDWVEDEAEVKC